MACCAFAVFLLAQLLAPVRFLADRLGLRGAWQPDAAVAWNPGAVAVAPPRRLPVGTLLIAVVALDLVLLATFRLTGVAADLPRFFTPDSNAARFEEALHTAICGPASRRN
jgi:hypothetical protein